MNASDSELRMRTNAKCICGRTRSETEFRASHRPIEMHWLPQSNSEKNSHIIFQHALGSIPSLLDDIWQLQMLLSVWPTIRADRTAVPRYRISQACRRVPSTQPGRRREPSPRKPILAERKAGEIPQSGSRQKD